MISLVSGGFELSCVFSVQCLFGPILICLLAFAMIYSGDYMEFSTVVVWQIVRHQICYVNCVYYTDSSHFFWS